MISEGWHLHFHSVTEVTDSLTATVIRLRGSGQYRGAHTAIIITCLQSSWTDQIEMICYRIVLNLDCIDDCILRMLSPAILLIMGRKLHGLPDSLSINKGATSTYGPRRLCTAEFKGR